MPAFPADGATPWCLRFDVPEYLRRTGWLHDPVYNTWAHPDRTMVFTGHIVDDPGMLPILFRDVLEPGQVWTLAAVEERIAAVTTGPAPADV